MLWGFEMFFISFLRSVCPDQTRVKTWIHWSADLQTYPHLYDRSCTAFTDLEMAWNSWKFLRFCVFCFIRKIACITYLNTNINSIDLGMFSNIVTFSNFFLPLGKEWRTLQWEYQALRLKTNFWLVVCATQSLLSHFLSLSVVGGWDVAALCGEVDRCRSVCGGIC